MHPPAQRDTQLCMRRYALLPFLLLAACDHISQRVWNCSNSPLRVVKVLSTGERINDVIPPRSYITSMEGGVQIVQLEAIVDGAPKSVWRQEQAVSANGFDANAVCGSREAGLIGQQF